MKNNIDNITFDNISLDKYKDEIEKISLIYQRLENDKSVQRTYEKYMKKLKKLQCNYNEINNTSGYDNVIKTIKMTFTVEQQQIEPKFSTRIGEII